MTGPHVSRAVGAFPRGLTDCSANDVLSISVCICSALLYVCAPRLYSQPLTKPYPGHRRPLHSDDCTRTLPHDVVSVYVNTSLSSHAAARRHRATLVIRGREHRRAFSLRRCPRLPPLDHTIRAEAYLPDFADLGPSAHEGARRAAISWQLSPQIFIYAYGDEWKNLCIDQMTIRWWDRRRLRSAMQEASRMPSLPRGRLRLG